MCLQEAPDVRELRLRFWDGCGLESNAIVGRRVDVEGLGTGKCEKMRQAKLSGGFLHRVIIDTGLMKEMKLLHAGPDGAGASGDVGFTVEDEQPADQPWRWSDDPRFEPPRPGHLGNLNPSQEAAKEVSYFQHLIVQFPCVLGGFWCVFDDRMLETEQVFRQMCGPEAQAASDVIVLRYLRANDYDVELARDQWEKTLAWRAEEDVESMMKTQKPPEVCRSGLLLQGLYPHMMAGYDRGGRPVRVECMGRVNTAEMYRHTTEELIMRYRKHVSNPPLLVAKADVDSRLLAITDIWQNEEIARRFLPAASRRTGHDQCSVTVVLDMTNGSLGDLLSSDARKHIQSFVQVLSDYFPETLNRMLIVNAPRLLSMAW